MALQESGYNQLYGSSKTAGTTIAPSGWNQFGTVNQPGCWTVIGFGADNLTATTPTISLAQNASFPAWTYQTGTSPQATAAAGSIAGMATCRCAGVTAAGTQYNPGTVTFSGSITARGVHSRTVQSDSGATVEVAATYSGSGGSGTITCGANEMAWLTISSEDVSIATPSGWTSVGNFATAGGGAASNIASSMSWKMGGGAFSTTVVDGSWACIVFREAVPLGPNGAAALTGVATISGATGSPKVAGAAAISQAGTVTATGTALIAPGAAAISGAGSITSAGTLPVIPVGVVGVVGTATIAANGQPRMSGAAALSGTATVTANGLPKVLGVAALGGTGTITAGGAGARVSGVAAVTAVGSIDAVGGNRIVTGAAALGGTGSITSAGTKPGATSGVAALIGAGTVTVTGSARVVGDAAVSGVGTVTAVGVAKVAGAAVLTAVGSIASGGISVTAPGQAAITAVGTIVVNGQPRMVGVVAIGATGSINSAGSPIISGRIGVAALIAAGTITTAGLAKTAGVVAISRAGTITASGARPGLDRCEVWTGSAWKYVDTASNSTGWVTGAEAWNGTRWVPL